MKKSKTKIDQQMKRKKNSELAETIILAKKKDNWNEIACILSRPRKNRISVNLDKINKNSEEGDLVVVPGKVLSSGEISKKIKLVSFNFSEYAKKKLKKSGCEILTIKDEIKLNPNAEGIKIVK